MENSLLKTTFHFSGILASVEGEQAKFLSFFDIILGNW